MRLYLRDLCGLRLMYAFQVFQRHLRSKTGSKDRKHWQGTTKLFGGAMMVENTVVRGLVAELAGVAAMTVAEKLEQIFTRRPNSYVPAHTLARLLGLPQRPDRERLGLNWAMHWGQGIVLGPVRTLMAERGVRGPVGSFLFLNLRLLNDQTLENATGVGTPPWTWPTDEQTVDLLHKAVYAFATGVVADRLTAKPRRKLTRAPVPREGWTPGSKP